MTTELKYTGEVKRPSEGDNVKRVQEWLSLHGFFVKIDGNFGPATELAVRQYQAARGLTMDGIVGPATFGSLTAPLRMALTPVPVNGRKLRGMTVAWAQQLLAALPREVGGQNRGPWVRTFMKGADGPDERWCAGFAFFCLERAAAALGVGMPIKPTLSCDELAARARRAKRLLASPSPAERGRIRGGSFFLIRRTSKDWTHTGIVIDATAEAFRTIEGNTNDQGSSNGDGVYQRTRGYKNTDFFLVD